MGSFTTPVGFYDRYNPLTTKWFRLLFQPGVDLQAAEMNEVQSLLQNQIGNLGAGVFADGTFLTGGKISTVSAGSGAGLTVNISAGSLWASAVHAVDAGTLTLTGNGTETIYLQITESVLPATDVSLLDPAAGAENYGYPGAARLLLNYAYVLNTDTGIPIATFIDGQLVTTPSNNGFLAQLYAILAQRTSEQFGQFVATRPTITYNDNADLSTSPLQFSFYVNGGVCYNQGYRLANASKINFSVTRPLTGQPRNIEPVTFLTGTLVYSLSEAPISSVNDPQGVQATIQSPTINMSRGLTINGSDTIPTQYQPVESVVSCTQSSTGHTYVQGTDFNRSGNLITWLSGGSQPATGTTYQLVVDYETYLTKGIRTFTSVSGETHTVASSGTTNLTHNDIINLATLVNTSTSTTLVVGVDYTLNTGTGAITWLSGHRPATGNIVSATYTYWAHTIEGDFVCRDSFRDTGGNLLLNITPTKTPSGITVDYLSQVSFDVVSGHVPVNGDDFFVNYNYSLGRIDILAWRIDGILMILPGTPGLTPAPPVVDITFVPIVKLNLPPEATAETMTLEWYNNLVMQVAEQRQVDQQVQNLQYSVGLLQLQTEALSINTDTPKKAIFTDDFSTPSNMDTGHPLFNGTQDFLAREFLLPRTTGSANPTVSSNTNATLMDDSWFLSYTESLALSQTLRSRPQVINQFSAINQAAVVTTLPALTLTDTDTLQVVTGYQINSKAASAKRFNPVIKTGQSMLTNVVSQSGAGASSYGIASPADDNLLNKIGVDPDWLAAAGNTASISTTATANGGFGLAANSSWVTVLTQLNVVTGAPVASSTLQLSGSNFKAGDRAIQCFFDGSVLPITPASGTLAETDGGYPGCVVASSSGTWAGTITTPANITGGTHTLSFVAKAPSSISTTSSLASCTFVTGGVTTTTKETVTVAKRPAKVPCRWIPALYMAGVLGWGGNQNLVNSVTGKFAYTIAYAIDGALLAGKTITNDLLVTAIQIAISASTLIYKFTTEASQLAAVCNYTTPGNVATNAAAMLALAKPAGTYANTIIGNASLCRLDPLAQTFTLNVAGFLSSINLYFNTLPTTDGVGVAIAEVNSGIPSDTYVAQKQLTVADITSTTGATTFTFDQPVYLDSDTEYAIVVLTNDTSASIWTAALGDSDTDTNTLILNNPYITGTMLISQNATTWQPILGQAFKFDINVCSFTQPTGFINFGVVSFTQASSIIEFYMPFSEPSQDTSIVYQYSLDNVTWQDFSPLKELDLGLAVTFIYLRIQLNGTVSLSPILQNYTALLYHIYQATGNYIGLEFEPTNAEFAETWLSCFIPGNTTLTVYVSFDQGSTWHAMSEITADAVNIDGEWFQRHFSYDSGAPTVDSMKFRVQLNSTVNSISPAITDYIGAAR